MIEWRNHKHSHVYRHLVYDRFIADQCWGGRKKRHSVNGASTTGFLFGKKIKLGPYLHHSQNSIIGGFLFQMEVESFDAF